MKSKKKSDKPVKHHDNKKGQDKGSYVVTDPVNSDMGFFSKKQLKKLGVKS
jgi:hypothetical protein